MLDLNKWYICPYCRAKHVVLKGRFASSFIPVENITGTEIYDAEFDKEKHKSHLLNCPKLQERWPHIKMKIAMRLKESEKLSVNNFLR